MDIDTNTTALVTGANGGIGQAIARALADAGAQVVLSARRADAVRGLAEELGARVVLADLAQRDAVERLAAEAGEIDILVANAALPAAGSILDYAVDEIDAALDVNLRAPIQLTRLLAPGMIARGRGQLVFISSIAGKLSTSTTALYSATKFGLRGFALAARQDLGPSGIGVSVIYPGFIRDAGMFADTGVKLPPGMGTRKPEDVARAVVQAVHDNPSEITVAALDQRFGAFVAGLAPNLIGSMERALGANNLVAASKKRK